MYLDDTTKNILKGKIGKDVLDLSKMSIAEEQSLIVSVSGKMPIFSKQSDSHIMGRGNPLIARRRISIMEDIDKKIMEL